MEKNLMSRDPESKNSARIDLLDIIKGISIFGIIIVNANIMNSPSWMHIDGSGFSKSKIDLIFDFLVSNIFREKFYSIFAFLFGLNSYLFWFKNKDQASTKDAWLTRTIIIFFLGLIDVSLIWWGDILIIYATVSLVLRLFFRQSVPIILGALIVVLLGIIACSLFIYQNPALFSYRPSDQELYMAQGTFLFISKKRIEMFYTQVLWGFVNFPRYPFYLATYLIYPLYVLFLMLGGLLAARLKFWNLPSGPQNTFRLALANLLVGILIIISRLKLQHNGFDYQERFLFSLFYFLTFVIFSRWKYSWRGLKFFASAGRMSLSIYLFSSLGLSILLYGYGFGLYAKHGAFFITAFALGSAIFFVIFSNLWLKIFPRGPIEWLMHLVITYFSKSLPLESAPLKY